MLLCCRILLDIMYSRQICIYQAGLCIVVGVYADAGLHVYLVFKHIPMSLPSDVMYYTSILCYNALLFVYMSYFGLDLQLIINWSQYIWRSIVLENVLRTKRVITHMQMLSLWWYCIQATLYYISISYCDVQWSVCVKIAL